jgi:hypothetical protein
MKRLLIALVTVAALAQAGVAAAGCWATAGLAPPPDGIAPGATWNARVTVLQHGVTPLPNAATARPTVTIVNEATKARKTFAARKTDDPTVFVARVVFPTAGSWRYEVYDDFSSWDGEPAPCAQTHTFAAVSIGGSGGGANGQPPAVSPVAAADSTGAGFRVWPIVAGVLGALAAVGLSAGLVRRRREAPEH